MDGIPGDTGRPGARMSFGASRSGTSRSASPPGTGCPRMVRARWVLSGPAAEPCPRRPTRDDACRGTQEMSLRLIPDDIRSDLILSMDKATPHADKQRRLGEVTAERPVVLRSLAEGLTDDRRKTPSRALKHPIRPARRIGDEINHPYRGAPSLAISVGSPRSARPSTPRPLAGSPDRRRTAGDAPSACHRCR